MENNFRGKRTTNDRFFKSIDLVLYDMYSIFNFSWTKNNRHNKFKKCCLYIDFKN